MRVCVCVLKQNRKNKLGRTKKNPNILPIVSFTPFPPQKNKLYLDIITKYYLFDNTILK